MNKTTLSLAFSTAFALLLSGCGEKDAATPATNAGGASTRNTAAGAPATPEVTWPELQELDVALMRMLQRPDWETSEVQDVAGKAKALATSPPPANIARPEETEILLADLASLAETLNVSTETQERHLLMDGMHEIVEKAYVTVGVPHSHAEAASDTSASQDHSHEGHDHSHEGHDHEDHTGHNH